MGEGNGEDMEKIWRYAFKKGLGDTEVAPSENPVLLTEAPLNPLRNPMRNRQILVLVHLFFWRNLSKTKPNGT